MRGAHIDPEAMHFVTAAYLDDVPPGGGGITLYPGSHRLLYEAVPESADLALLHLHLPPEAAPPVSYRNRTT